MPSPSNQLFRAEARPKGESPARPLGFVLSVLGICGAGWSAWTDFPSLSAPVEIAVPLLFLVIAARFPDEVSLGPPDKTDGRGSLFAGLMITMLGLALGAWREFRELVIDYVVAAWTLAAIGIGISFALAAARIDKKQMADGLMFVLTGGAAALWGAGVLAELNGHLPERSFIQTNVTVADKQVWHGGRGSTSYHLFLKVRPDAAAGAMTVMESFYNRTSVGAHLCVIRPTGALGALWWQVADCRQLGQPMSANRR